MPKTSKKAMSKMGKEASEALSKSLAYKNGVRVSKGLFSNGVTKGTAQTIRNMNKGVKFTEAITKAHTVNGKLSASRIAGTAATIGVAGRIATGGGLYRDRYGNFNLPGIPFI